MANKKSTPARAAKKGLMGKKAEIYKLIEEANRKKSLSGTKLPPGTASVRLPPLQPSSRDNPRGPLCRQPKKIVPGLIQDQKPVLLESEHLHHPGKPLVCLPCEPDTMRALRYAPKGHFPFLELPGELRNKIYDYGIVKQYYEIGWVDNNHKSKSLTYRLPKLGRAYGPRLESGAARRRRQLDYSRRVPSQKRLVEGSIYPGPAALLVVCSKMHKEACSVFYSKSTFTFHGLGALRHFLNNLSPTATEALTRLGIKHRAYGEPNRTEDQMWKAKHDRLWEDLCWRIADQCSSLTRLSLDLTLNKSPLWFAPFDLADKAGIGAQWIKPLWGFQDVGIQRCWVRLHCLSKDSSILEVESWKVRKEILGALWDEEAEAQRDAYGFEKRQSGAKEVQKGMVLRLRVDGGLEGA
ncbi:hypothetical protein HO133_008787 [Letharia lupina]|uniref:DUF7730 domain-containing protein n=1 Tax=Letharia lupina TaxID=560253 RepID=A0A8H6FGT4_9LECA|nr:uncharacterized protein HO133_008787 [Letharia lupina]KAF6227343.1 hypothetical protein HO133_008787 [Letharia lupina]